MINHDSKCIFIHIIKTGGVSIATALEMKERQFHASASEIRKKVGEKVWNEYYKFSFIRNPWEKLVSSYHYNHEKWVPKNTSFENYVKLWNTGSQITRHPPQNSPYLNEDIDFIGRFEKLEEDFQLICKKRGILNTGLPHMNKTSHRHYSEYYTEEMIEIVAKKFSEDIERFEYKFVRE